jgi:ABC-type oligopeptide transport system substrate-binding subunit
VSQATGTLLNSRYRLEAEIGRGGMGVVYRGHDTLLDRYVAVKVLSQAVLDSGGRARLLQEARATARLNHANIVSVYDAGEAESSPYVVMELMEGGSLHSHRPHDLPTIVSIGRQLSAALQHAHSHGFIHRDLKPENVLLTRDPAETGLSAGTQPLAGIENWAKLSDFGLARSITSRVSTEGTITGTVYYLAPEQALGREMDARVDLYALGVLLYELTTGQLPFAGDDPLAVIFQILHTPVVPPQTRNAAIPPQLDALIVRLLSKDPAARPASAAEVSGVLDRPDLLDREAVTLPEVSVLERIERGRMVGRDREMQQARALWAQAQAGQGHLLLIMGESGIGKTRLAQSLATQAQISGGRVLQGACYAEGGMPYAPFVQLLRGALAEDRERDASLGLPERVLGNLLGLAPAVRADPSDARSGLSPEDHQVERHRLFEDMVLLFTDMARHSPLMVIVEDIHWADSGTLGLLRHLARHLRRQRVLLVVTSRDVEGDAAQPLLELMLELQRERLATRMKLFRLDREQTCEMLAALFAEEITPEFLDGIYNETEGNPFFIEEVCRALVESGRLYYAEGRWHRPDVQELGIPHSVSVAIQSRVRVLPAAARQTLDLAAVVGRTFELDTLAAASDLEEALLLDALEDARRAQLVEEQGDGRTFTFVHGLVASTLTASLTTTQRQRLHGQVAEAMERVCPADLEALAYHYDRASNGGKAIQYLLKAGDRARGLYAFDEAIAHYERALALLKERGERERAAETLMRMALVYTAAFQPDRAREAYDRAFDLWEPLRDVVEQPAVRPAVRALRFAVEEPLTLDPAMVSDDVSTFITAQLFEGLVRVDSDHNVLPAVAARWKVADRGRRYTFRLREGLRWSDGSPLTARDFELAWQRNLRLTPPAPNGYLLYVIENARAFSEGRIDDPGRVGVRALDDHVLEIRLDQPIAYLPQLLACPIAYPLPRRAVEGGQEVGTEPGAMVGNGAYRLAEWRRGERLVLARNAFYHGRFPGNVERVECAVLREYGQALDGYAADQADIVGLINADPGTIARARAAHGRELVFTPQASTLYYAFRTDRPPFNDVRVRQALVHAIDREALVREASEGQYLPANGGFVPPGMPGHSPDIGLAFDVDRARKLLAQAGYPGGRGFPQVAWLYSGRTAGDPVVPFLRRAWQETLGLELQPISLDWGEFMRRRDLDWPDLCQIGWSADLPDPDIFLRTNYHSTQGLCAGRCGWRNARFDALVEEAVCMADLAKRMALYQAADRILVREETAIMPLFYAQGRILVKPWVSVPRVAPALLNLKEVILEAEER